MLLMILWDTGLFPENKVPRQTAKCDLPVVIRTKECSQHFDRLRSWNVTAYFSRLIQIILKVDRGLKSLIHLDQFIVFHVLSHLCLLVVFNHDVLGLHQVFYIDHVQSSGSIDCEIPGYPKLI